MKKLMSILLMLVVVFSISSAVFAEDEVDAVPPPATEYQTGPDSEYHGEWGCDPFGKCGYTMPQYAPAISGYTYLGQDFAYFTSWTIGEWDEQVSDTTFSSTGGNFKINVRGQSVNGTQTGMTSAMEIAVWEDDGASGDDHIKTYTLYPKTYDQILTFSTEGFKDGLNNKAEIYLKVTNNYSVSGGKGYFYFYD